MKKLMVSAMSSDSGKTVITTALLQVLKTRGVDVRAFKCGPDYIDPMFHRRALGIPGENLDIFLQGREQMQRILHECTGEFALIEGAMGFYDGVGGTCEGSAWEIAALSDTPVILVVRAKGTSVTLAAQIQGMLHFKASSHIAGILLNDCTSMLYAHLKEILERETEVPVLGYLPHMEEAVIPSRHLGLVTPQELEKTEENIQKVAAALEKSCDLNNLFSLSEEEETQVRLKESAIYRCRIAVARDEAFCFYYEDNLRQLRNEGAELVMFSPLRDKHLPDVDAIYLGGGYPELYAGKLADNGSLRHEIREKIQKGMPVIAECGGFLYLQKKLRDKEGILYPMVGVLDGESYPTEHLQRFGYLTLKAEEDSMLFSAGDMINAHEFHYWKCTENGTALLADKRNGKKWRCAFVSESMYASFPHLHFASNLPIANRFVETAVKYRSLEHAD